MKIYILTDTDLDTIQKVAVKSYNVTDEGIEIPVYSDIVSDQCLKEGKQFDTDKKEDLFKLLKATGFLADMKERIRELIERLSGIIE